MRAVRVAGGAVVLAAAIASCSRTGPDAAPPSSTLAPSSDSAAIRTAIDAYARTRNGTDLAAFRATICSSVAAENTPGSRPSPVHVVVDHVGAIRVTGESATATVDLRYQVGGSGSLQTIGPFTGIEWLFVREDGSWKQCSPPRFSQAGSARPAG
ncbi:Rv0361 family membrane protein [Williamsia sp. Leaf354]|uniref:Rv0361 family membrane protein n=1 Tax=Williamsia sp. Leaf354 TaxID=1736349 RepID=UPI000B1E648A|nr:hypothetical protein [Williamsia sp. Leaf354]